MFGIFTPTSLGKIFTHFDGESFPKGLVQPTQLGPFFLGGRTVKFHRGRQVESLAGAL